MLTEKLIRDLKRTGREQNRSDNTRDHGTGRLYLTVRPSGNKEFRVRRRVLGRWRWKKLGDWPGMSLEIARQAFREEMKKSPYDGQGLDTERAYGTLGDLCDAYCIDMRLRGRVSWSEAAGRLERGIKFPFPSLWNTPAREVTTKELVDVLAYHIQKGSKVQVNRLRSWLHAAYQFGLTAENDPKVKRSAGFGLGYNPVSSIPRQGQWESVGEGLLSPEAFRLAWVEMPKMRERVWNAVPLVHLVIATAGQRITSLLKLRVRDVHLDRRLMDIPASAMKAKKPHIVPLNDQAVQVLKPLIELAHMRQTELLFPNRKDYRKPMLLCSQSALVDDFRKRHGVEWQTSWVRRTAKTVLGELQVSRFDRDRLHGHAVQDVSGKHYDRYDYLREKRIAMRLWGEWLDGVMRGVDIRLRYLDDQA
ncbi:tyrosine-type recombinase/integrase [Salinicola tamaricis]|uniref:tyrosine-type recombinase/integrase n=1 Tax=Salinicola tamaricis TaxID=1771309 RepID=UPI000D099F2B|nr:tyrosine-type recombinase/integrase [Salinicola tamaricis]